MIDTPTETEPSPEFKALTMVTSALADTLDKADLLDAFVRRLQRVAEEARADAAPEDAALKWVDAITQQLVMA